jgi:glycosyltransferase involved in cell wall biosynthesis
MNTTSSNKWHGTPVGIIRVERELSLRIHHQPFVIDGDGFKKNNLTPKTLLKNDSSEMTSFSFQRNKAHGFLVSAQMLSRKQRIVKSFAYFISLFYGFDSKIDRTLDRAVYYAYKYLKQFYVKLEKIRRLVKKPKSLKTINTLSVASKVSSPFSKGDIVFTCGLDWDNSVLEKLHTLKKDVDFKLVTVIYDLIPITNPEFIQNTRHVNRLLGHFTLLAQLSDLVLVNTRATATEFEKFCSKLEIGAPEVRIVPWGTGFELVDGNNEVSELLPLIKTTGYYLAVGTIEIRKNYQLLVNIIKLAREQSVEIPHFVFVGAPGWGTHELITEIENDELLQKSITWLRNSSDEKLKWLYQNCIAVLSPSFNEGYGLPVAEAQSLNKKTFLSDIAVYRELFPESTFISPNDPAAWLNAITQDNQSTLKSSPIHNWDDSSRIVADTVSDFFGIEIKLLRE